MAGKEKNRAKGGFNLPIARNPKSIKTVYWGFVGAFALIMGYLGVIAYKQPVIRSSTPPSLNGLSEAYRTHGIQRFLTEKNTLKLQVSDAIKNAESKEAKNQAESIAVYLFPEILPDTHFEKQAAMGAWNPLFLAIEKEPGTLSARNYYEDAKAEIWNYENPDKKNPRLSSPAIETLKIYRELSAP